MRCPQRTGFTHTQRSKDPKSPRGDHRELGSGRLCSASKIWFLQTLACFFFSAFFQRGFARKFYAAFVVDADAFHPDHVAHLGHVFGSVHAEIRQLGNVDEAVLAREHFDERAELFDRDDAAVIGLADFDLARSCRR